MARPSANSGDYLRRYRNVRKSDGAEDRVFVLEIEEDDRQAAAKLNFSEWAEEHDWYLITEADRADEEDGRITQPIVTEFELAFVRYYKEQRHKAVDQKKLVAQRKKLVAQFNKAVDVLRELQCEAALAASSGDRLGEHAWQLATLLLDPPIPSLNSSGRIQARVTPPEKARQLLGAFAHHRELSSQMGAPWTHERQCAHALAQAWHRAFRSLPNEGQRELFHNLLCSILPGDDPPEMALTYRTLQRLRESGQFRERARTPWDGCKK